MEALRWPATRIDVHHHIVPDFYREWLIERGQQAGGLPIPTWSLAGTQKIMDTCSTRCAVLSVSTPAAEPASGAEASAIARGLNQYCHHICTGQPDRFGYFATLALPDVDRSLKELAYAYDDLDADGIMLLANAKGIYLGDPVFEPLMAELERRHAVVFVHPSQLPGSSGPDDIPAYTADFLLDTTRAALNLCRHGVLGRYPHIRFILCHGGGMIPYAAFRLAPAASPTGNPIDGLRLLRRFYYDTALTPTPFSMPALLRFAARGHILFGSDYLYAPPKASKLFARILSAYPSAQHCAINHSNAEALIPRLKR